MVEAWRPQYTKTGESRRKSCRRDLKKYLLTFHKQSFNLGMSSDHKRLIKEAEKAILDGTLIAVAMPRGSGKTTILSFAILWAALYGHHRYLILAAADDPKARKILAKIKAQLERNDLLYESFPEVCGPIRCLDGSAIRANFQKYDGQSTDLVFSSSRIVLPTIPQSVKRKNAAVVLEVGGIESAIRGAQYTIPRTGETVRPTCLLVDDPQTRKTAKSKEMTEDRLAIVTGDMLGMAPPDQDMSALVAGTVIRPNDLMDRLLDPKICPGWDSIRVAMLKSMPSRMDLWEEYRRLLLQADAEKRKPTEAFAYYRKNRKEMDAGAVAYWPDRIKGGAISAVQTAMTIWARDPETFASEYQNAPIDGRPEEGTDLNVTLNMLVQSIAAVPRGTVPMQSHKVTAMIDVSGLVLWWMVASFTEKFDPHAIEYGTWPQQNGYVTKDSVDISLQAHYGLELRDSIDAGVGDCISHIMSKNWLTPGGESIPVDVGFVDAHWGEMTGMLRDCVWSSPWKSSWFPVEGHGITSRMKALNDVKGKPERREVRGIHWRQSPEKDGLRVIYDTNFWKTIAARKLQDGRATFHAGSVKSHQMLIDHLLAEGCNLQRNRREVYEWYLKSGEKNEHYWDCFVGCHVAASIAGVELPGEKPPRRRGSGDAKPIRFKDFRK